MKNKKPKLAQLDPNIRTLVMTLNAFDGVQTIGSCGGHENPSPAQWGKGTFYVKFDVDWTTEGASPWSFLAWFFNDYCRKSDVSGNVRLLPVAATPFINTPGECLFFVVEGFNEADPELIGSRLSRLRKEAFMAPDPMGLAAATSHDARLHEDSAAESSLPRLTAAASGRSSGHAASQKKVRTDYRLWLADDCGMPAAISFTKLFRAEGGRSPPQALMSTLFSEGGGAQRRGRSK